MLCPHPHPRFWVDVMSWPPNTQPADPKASSPTPHTPLQFLVCSCHAAASSCRTHPIIIPPQNVPQQDGFRGAHWHTAQTAAAPKPRLAGGPWACPMPIPRPGPIASICANTTHSPMPALAQAVRHPTSHPAAFIPRSTATHCTTASPTSPRPAPLLWPAAHSYPPQTAYQAIRDPHASPQQNLPPSPNAPSAAAGENAAALQLAGAGQQTLPRPSQMATAIDIGLAAACGAGGH